MEQPSDRTSVIILKHAIRYRFNGSSAILVKVRELAHHAVQLHHAAHEPAGSDAEHLGQRCNGGFDDAQFKLERGNWCERPLANGGV